MRKKSSPIWPEVFFSTTETSSRVAEAVRLGELRRIAPRLYTSRLDLGATDLLRKNWRAVVAGYFPGSVIGFRTAIEGTPTAEGQVFITAATRRLLKLDGFVISATDGPGPLDSDLPLPGGLFWASRARAFLESARATRARGGAPRGLKRQELEERLERILRIEGDGRLNALRDEMRRLAVGQPGAEASPLPDAENAFDTLDGIIGALLGTRSAKGVTAPAALARIAGTPVDQDRVELFTLLHEHLVGLALPAPPDPAPEGRAAAHLAFLDAYFSNYIEGTEFEIGEARDIVFEGKVLPARADDTHDIMGTFELLNDRAFIRRSSVSRPDPDDFLAELQAANRRILRGRPVKRPGEFKETSNRAGNTVFVQPELVRGTLREGYALVRALEHPFARAAAVMFLVSEVHPFDDGNGRVARAFMNAELVAAGHCRILIPTVFRDDYLGGLRALSRHRRPGPFVEALEFAQRVTGAVRYDDLDVAIGTLERAHAFDDEAGARLRLPTGATNPDAE
jgi:hypothetical protein